MAENEPKYDVWRQGDRRQGERRTGIDRRGGLRWDPRGYLKERRKTEDRRQYQPLRLPEGAE